MALSRFSLISIDPGERAGIAYFQGEVLVKAEAVRSSEPFSGRRYSADRIVLEVPFAYPRSGVDPNRLITLAVTAGRLAGRFSGRVEKVYPRAWKGQRPKHLDTMYTYDLLLPKEKRIVDDSTSLKMERHNVLDAVGIGLWALKRRRR